MSTPIAKKVLSLLCGIALAVAGAFFGDIRPPESFAAAKKLARNIYADDPLTFYCGCSYRDNRIDLASCGYRPRQNSQRASRLEWEHVVPAWDIGHQRACWKTGGRDNCSAKDRAFSQAEADLHNLVPEIGEVNGDRSNFGFGMLDKAPSQYGQCRTVVDFQARKIMPREEVRGAVARIYLYMHDRYRLRMAKQDRQLYEAWNRQYPVTEWERQRNQKVACQMGWGNAYVGEVELWRCGFGGIVTSLFDTGHGLIREGLGVALKDLLKH